MRSIAVLFLLAACAGPAIPVRHGAPHTAVAGAPALAPCALVHLEEEERLTNGARDQAGAWTLEYSTFVVRHPRGVVLIDAAFGDTAAADLDDAPFWFRWQFSSARAAKPLAALLAEIGIKPEEVTHVLLTHAHWDHTGGLAQLPNARVVMSADDGWILSAKGGLVDGGMPRHFETVKDRIDPVTFTGPAESGFERSQDLFGDGSIVAVPTPGHTPGATSYFVQGAGPRRWMFVGDAAWVREGFEKPVMKGRLASTFSDKDAQRTAETLGALHAVYESGTSVVTSHDGRTWTGIPRCR